MKRWRVPALALAVLQAAPALAADAPAGALSCTGCHTMSRTLHTTMPRLAGRPAADVAAALRDFREGKRPATVMGRIAKGFSDPEIAAIAAWFEAER